MSGLLVNLGKWVLRHLFTGLIDEELKWDADYRATLEAKARETNGLVRSDAPTSIDIPTIVASSPGGHDADIRPPIGSRNPAASSLPVTTPGMAIGIASPGAPTDNPVATPLTSAADGASSKGQSGPRDYFSMVTKRRSAETPNINAKTPATTTEENGPPTPSPLSPSDPDKEEKKRTGSLFSKKKFQMSFPKKLGRNSTDTKPIVEEKVEEPPKTPPKKEKVYDDHFCGVIDKIRDGYEKFLTEHPGQPLNTAMCPSSVEETPDLNLPPHIDIIIQEDRMSRGVPADLYRGTIGTVGRDADQLEQAAPAWLGKFLLKVSIHHSFPAINRYLTDLCALGRTKYPPRKSQRPHFL